MSYKIAGIDVHKKVLMVVVVDASTPEERPERRRFATMPSELRRLSTWLREQGVEEAVMESTAQYWRSVWLELEPYMRLQLAQAFSNRAPRGRKHDFKDAERLVRRLIANELILSFVPNGEQRTWRNLTRMKTQTQLLCFVHAGCQSSACHPLQAHLVLETGSSFRLILHWKRLPFDLPCPNTLHFYRLPVLAGPVRDTPPFREGFLPGAGKCKRTKSLSRSRRSVRGGSSRGRPPNRERAG